MSVTVLDRSLSLFARVALWLVFLWYAGYVANAHFSGYAAAARGDRPFYTDFTHTYASSLLLREQPAENLFIDGRLVEAMHRAARAAFGDSLSYRQVHSVNFAPWMYPPTFIFVVAPLAFLPYLLAYLSWMAATLSVYLAAMRTILPSSSAWPFALAAPPVLNNLMYGQSGFLIAGLIGLGLSQIERRPVLAGVLIGMASVKPHLGILIPFALAAGGHWRAFEAASVTTVALVVASVFAFGIEPWFATIGSIEYFLQGFELGAYDLGAMVSVVGAVGLLGGDAETMWSAQHLATAAMITLVSWVWWSGRNRAHGSELQCAILCFATPLAVPSAYVYDLVLLVPGAAWVWIDLRERGARQWEHSVLAGAMGALLVIYPVARNLQVPLGPLCVFALLGLALWRYFLSAPRATLARAAHP